MHEFSQYGGDSCHGVQRCNEAGAGAPQCLCGVSFGVGQRDDRPTGAEVFIDLGRHLRIAIRRLQYQEAVDRQHLFESRNVVDGGCELHDVPDLPLVNHALVLQIAAGGPQCHLQTTRDRVPVQLQQGNCVEETGGVALTWIDDSAVKQFQPSVGRRRSRGRTRKRDSAFANVSSSKPFSMTWMFASPNCGKRAR